LSSGFFHESVSPRALIVGLHPFLIVMSIDGDIQLEMFYPVSKTPLKNFEVDELEILFLLH